MVFRWSVGAEAQGHSECLLGLDSYGEERVAGARGAGNA